MLPPEGPPNNDHTSACSAQGSKRLRMRKRAKSQWCTDQPHIALQRTKQPEKNKSSRRQDRSTTKTVPRRATYMKKSDWLGPPCVNAKSKRGHGRGMCSERQKHLTVWVKRHSSIAPTWLNLPSDLICLAAKLLSTLHWSCHAIYPWCKARHLFTGVFERSGVARGLHLLLWVLVTQAWGIKLAFAMCLLQSLHCTDEAHIGRNRGSPVCSRWRDTQAFLTMSPCHAPKSPWTRKLFHNI